MNNKPAGAPVMNYPSVPAPTQITPTPPPLPTGTPMHNTPVPMPPQYTHYQQPAYGIPYGSGPWSYQHAAQLPPQPIAPAAPGPPVYYQIPGPATITHNPTNQPCSYPPPPPIYRGRSHANLQWQPSYTGPRINLSVPNQIHYYEIPPLRPQTTSMPTHTQ